MPEKAAVDLPDTPDYRDTGLVHRGDGWRARVRAGPESEIAAVSLQAEAIVRVHIQM